MEGGEGEKVEVGRWNRTTWMSSCGDVLGVLSRESGADSGTASGRGAQGSVPGHFQCGSDCHC